MIERGILPEGTELTPINPMPEGTFSRGDAVRPWDDAVRRREARCSRRMAEVYAGFSEYTDAPGRADRRLPRGVRASSTTRSSSTAPTTARRARAARTARSTRASSSTAIPTTIEENLAMIDQLGSRRTTYNHYPTGWAVAFSTPYRMFKRYTYQGGVCDPLVIHWPAGIKARGRGARPVPPLAPTSSRRSSTAAGSRCPTVVNGAEQYAAAGRLDALLVRRGATRRRRRRRSTTRCSGTRGHLARGLEGGHRARPDQRA